MKNNNYTMGDIAQFIIDYKESNKYDSKDVPDAGDPLYETTILENSKRSFFERKYYEALAGTEEEQAEFIERMAPVLDDFYANRERSKGSK